MTKEKAATTKVGSRQISFVRMATTTSTNDTGLLPLLKAGFEADYPEYFLTWVSVGSGAALDLGRAGVVDVCFTHSPAQEVIFYNQGFATSHPHIMFNQFIGVGPRGVTPAPPDSLTALFYDIYHNELPFVSRGDLSGTHVRELEIWASLGIADPTDNPNYQEAHAGMLATIELAAVLGAYTLSDDATWLRAKTDNPFVNFRLHQVTTVVQPASMNQYSVLPINPLAPFPVPPVEPINEDGAEDFTAWLLGTNAENIINGFQIAGQQVFTYNAHA